MNILFTKIRDKHALWYKGIVFAFCVAVCTYLLPKNNSSQINQVNVGDVWLNNELISSIDFLVKKTNAELTTEKKELSKQIVYFKKKSSNINSLISKLTELPHHKAVTVKLVLDSIYEVGVYYSNESKDFQDSLMYIVSNNEVALTRKQTLFDKEKLNQILSQQIKDAIIVTQLLGEIKPNIVYDEILSNEMAIEEPEVNYIYKSKIEKGDVLLRKNDIVTEEQTQILKSYHLALSEQEIETTQLSIIVGQFLACILVLGIMMLFLAFFRKSIFSQNTQVTFIFLIILLIIIITSIVAKYNVNYIYAVPFCLVPILIRVFFDSRTSLFNFLNIILICAFFTPDKFEFVFT